MCCSPPSIYYVYECIRQTPIGARVWVRDTCCELWQRGTVVAYAQHSGAPVVRPTVGLPKTTDGVATISSTWGEVEAQEAREWDELSTSPPGLTFANTRFTSGWGGWSVAMAHGDYSAAQAVWFALARFLLFHLARPMLYLLVFATATGPPLTCDASNALVVSATLPCCPVQQIMAAWRYSGNRIHGVVAALPPQCLYLNSHILPTAALS
eukprot:COSAG05_NODE_268_length_12518_cov_6.452774_12_plen_210_part_00